MPKGKTFYEKWYYNRMSDMEFVDCGNVVDDTKKCEQCQFNNKRQGTNNRTACRIIQIKKAKQLNIKLIENAKTN